MALDRGNLTAARHELTFDALSGKSVEVLADMGFTVGFRKKWKLTDEIVEIVPASFLAGRSFVPTELIVCLRTFGYDLFNRLFSLKDDIGGSQMVFAWDDADFQTGPGSIGRYILGGFKDRAVHDTTLSLYSVSGVIREKVDVLLQGVVI